MRRWSSVVPVLAVLVALSACNGDNNPAGPSESSGTGSCGGNDMGTVRATVDGQAKNFPIVQGFYMPRKFPDGPWSFNVQGADCTQEGLGVSILIQSFNESLSTRTYAIQGNAPLFVIGIVGVNPTVAGGIGAAWQTDSQGGSGSVTLTTLTTTRAVGTFTYVAPAKPGTPATGTRTVSNGSFDIEYPVQ